MNIFKIVFIFAVSLLGFSSCVIEESYGRHHAVTTVGVYDILPVGFNQPYYRYGNRYYYGGVWEPGRVLYEGRYYPGRYSYANRYFYGGHFHTGGVSVRTTHDVDDDDDD